jgi:Glyoxalase-like domain
MNIDHIFICTNDNGKIADDLIEFGLTEGSSRVHAGQGTRNRKFYFDNFFLEILWVCNEPEIKSDLVKPTGLWQRAGYKRNEFAPYGLCLINTEDTNALFENALHYQPIYFPAGMMIEILINESQPSLPWTFRLPFKGQKKDDAEPRSHQNGIQQLTKAIFNYSKPVTDQYLQFFKNEPSIEFSAAADYGLTLIFDGRRQQNKKYFKDLKLTIEY